MSWQQAYEIEFTRDLLRWHAEENDRSLPWKGETDPYKIWVSEILLQQTRAEQALPYYHRFLEAFPNIRDLAGAPKDKIYRIWQGLGYYRRCQNMIRTAKILVEDFHGKFPSTYAALRQLPGIGPYTAAAIASFAFGKSHAVMDGNVIRVLSRHFGIEEYTDLQPGKRILAELAQRLIAPADPRSFNQAIMDFGARVCKPAAPDCPTCPLIQNCKAWRDQKVTQLPLSRPKRARSKRYFFYFILENQGRLWIRKRTQKDIWHQLHEPYLLEAEGPLTLDQLKQHAQYTRSGSNRADSSPLSHIVNFQQTLTHQKVIASVYHLPYSAPPNPDTQGFWVTASALDAFAFPKKIASILQSQKERILGSS